ncbi:uncharacterized protein [Diadema setosum]|uniref:uncharacterized protein isoform X3 n=1 Tax=Diadema setosum TaxID=31175 RepID=UPI003B3B1176
MLCNLGNGRRWLANCTNVVGYIRIDIAQRMGTMHKPQRIGNFFCDAQPLVHDEKAEGLIGTGHQNHETRRTSIMKVSQSNAEHPTTEPFPTPNEDPFLAADGDYHLLRRISCASTTGVRFAPPVNILYDENEVRKHIADTESSNPSYETLGKRHLNAFAAQIEDFKKGEVAKTCVRRVLGRLSSVLCFLSMLTCIFTIADLEMSYKCGTAYSIRTFKQSTNVTEGSSAYPVIMKSFVTSGSVLMCIILIIHYHFQCRYLIIVHQLPTNATVITSPLRNSFLLELLLCFVHVPPYFDALVPSELQLSVFLRLYLTARYMKEHNEMMRTKSTRFLASVLKTELTSGYLIKTFFLKRPFVMITICYILNLVGSGYLVFAMDRYDNPSHHNSFLDTVWMQAVTMTTLGFGDVTPDSLLGRAFVSFSAVCGIFLMALLISVIHEGLQLTQQEKRIIAYVERIDDQWVKEFVADNTAIMLTDVLRKIDNLEQVLGGEQTEEGMAASFGRQENRDERCSNQTEENEEIAQKHQSMLSPECTEQNQSRDKVITAWDSEDNAHVDGDKNQGVPVILVQDNLSKPGDAATSNAAELVEHVENMERSLGSFYMAMRTELSIIKAHLKHAD